MDLQSRILVAGPKGMVGSAIVRRLQAGGYERLITPDRLTCDLESAAAVDRLFESERPEFVFLAAAKVGGILANLTQPVEFLRANLRIQDHVISACHRHGVTKLLFLGSSCIYPRLAPQPIKEEDLLSGGLEPSNEGYAIAKIAGIKLCQAYRAQYGLNAIALMPTNLYGPGDNFDLNTSHVLPALLRKFHEARATGAKEVVLWGTGTPCREFLHVDDLADACLHLMRNYDGADIVNVGTGEDLSIRELAERVGRIVGYQGSILLDPTKPDGTPRKLLDVSRLHELGWRHRIGLEEGIRSTYQWFQEHLAEVRT
jgi:GDP-L-fucose synthase